MQIEVTEKYLLELKQVYNPVVISAQHISVAVCERDGIIELCTETHVVRVQQDHVEVIERGPKMGKEYCRGCYNDDYNHGLGGAKECWSFADAKLKMRKIVHINQVPPWTQKPQLLPSCYTMQKHVIVDGDREC